MRGVDLRRLLCLLVLGLSPGAACAWALNTHLYFAHWLVLALPLADPELRRAAARLPGLVLAGACLPDLALAGRVIGTPAFRRAHSWSTLRRLGAAPRHDADRALAIGYASHLVADVIAHNVFVPEHEARIARIRHLTHAIAEFAMDEHLRDARMPSASETLRAAHAPMVDFVDRAFRCGAPLAERASSVLASADAALRASRLPRACRRIVGHFYRDPAYRFEGYLAAVRVRLQDVEAALGDRYVDWTDSDPEGRPCNGPADRRTGEDIARIMQAQHDA